MKEDFLHLIWKQRLFNQNDLQTTSGEKIEIIHVGYLNTDAGPDFFNAKIKIGTTLWAGNVEIHLKKSDWIMHKHENNPNYSNIILHVILEDDLEPTMFPNLARIPTLKLTLPERITKNYHCIEHQNNSPICGNSIDKINKIELKNYLEYILIERFEEKSISAQKILNQSNGCWSTLFYYLLLRTLGGHTNNPTFEQLAKHLPFKILSKHSNNQFQLEALLFGTAGFLTNPVDPYQKELQIEFNFLKIKYNITPISEHLWKFLRLRPSNFPTYRIAQLAAIIHKNGGLFEPQSTISTSIEPFIADVSKYWRSHYQFGIQSENKKSIGIGAQTLQMILCNVVIPYLFVYYKNRGEIERMQETIEIMHQLPTENNKIIRTWAKLGIQSDRMADSQALYHLFTRYCEPKKCLSCRIGQMVLTKYEF